MKKIIIWCIIVLMIVGTLVGCSEDLPTVKQKPAYAESCTSCGGNGVCFFCEGKGYYNLPQMDGSVDSRKCSVCKGNGICRTCDGKGYK